MSGGSRQKIRERYWRRVEDWRAKIAEGELVESPLVRSAIRTSGLDPDDVFHPKPRAGVHRKRE